MLKLDSISYNSSNVDVRLYSVSSLQLPKLYVPVVPPLSLKVFPLVVRIFTP